MGSFAAVNFMNPTKRKLFIFIFFSFSIAAFGQKNDALTEKLLWRTRADTVTGNLLKELPKISELKRALLLAEIGRHWWKTDPSQSNAWFEKSVDTVFFYSFDAASSEKKEYFETTRNILAILANRNQKQADRLIKILTSTEKNAENEKETNADSLIKYALQIVRENPEKAAQVGILALRTGHPTEYHKLIWELRRHNAPLADRLFREAFSMAKSSRDYSLLQGIQLAVLPESQLDDFPISLSAPTQQKIEVLNFFADYIVQLQANYKAKIIAGCRNEAFLVFRSKKIFDALLPQKAGIVQQAIDVCLDRQTQNSFDAFVKSEREQTVEELLKAADDSRDNRLSRTAYLTKAVLLGAKQKSYALVIKIINDLTEEDYVQDAEFWEQMRYDAAGNLAYLQYQESDLQGSGRTLENVPAAYRPFAQMIFVLRFPAEDVSSYGYRVEILAQARRGFIKSEKSFILKSSYWFQLVKIYSNNRLQDEAAAVFKEIVSAFNNAFSEKQVNSPRIDSDVISRVFSASLIEAQDNLIFETASLLNESESRRSVNLAFLKIALQKYESIKPVSSKGF